jgi:hypothetical protein
MQPKEYWSSTDPRDATKGRSCKMFFASPTASHSGEVDDADVTLQLVHVHDPVGIRWHWAKATAVGD